MRVLVTGSMGFVGSHMMDALRAKGHEVLGLDKKVGSDITDMEYITKTIDHLFPNPDVILHCAATCSTAKGITDAKDAFLNNTLGTFSMLDYAQKHNIHKFIHISTCKIVEGDDGKITPYGGTKLAAETMVETFKDTYGLDVIINRPGTIYGPGQEGSAESGWVSWFLEAKKHNIKLKIFGDGKQVRDLLYIDDLVELLIDQIENFDLYKNKVYSVGGGEENAVSLLDLLEFLDYDNYVFADARLGDNARFVSPNHISHVNNWSPKTPWQVGVGKTLDYLEEKKL